MAKQYEFEDFKNFDFSEIFWLLKGETILFGKKSKKNKYIKLKLGSNKFYPRVAKCTLYNSDPGEFNYFEYLENGQMIKKAIINENGEEIETVYPGKHFVFKKNI